MGAYLQMVIVRLYQSDHIEAWQGHSKIVNLAQQEYSSTLESGRVYRPVMRGAFEAKLRRS